MKNKFFWSLNFSFLIAILASSPLEARPKTMFSCELEANQYLYDQYNQGVNSYNQQQWHQAANSFEKVIRLFPETPLAATSSFYLGVCYFERKEFDFANYEFSAYLKVASHPEYFEEALYYKYWIAEHLKTHKRRPFTVRYFPKVLSGQSLALEIYDEITACIPNHELAVLSLFSKAALLQSMRDYRASIETYQLLIKKFPRDELTPESYLKISESYYQLSRLEFQNPDLLTLADLNVKKFEDFFPRDERLAAARLYSEWIKEVYANGLYSVGRFYERTHHPDAAAIYYQSAIEEYPTTKIAEYSRCRLNTLNYQDEDADEPVAPALDEEQAPTGPIMLNPQKMYEPKQLPDTNFD